MKPILFFLILIVRITILITAADAEYYRWIDDKRVIHFADECGIIPMEVIDKLMVSSFPGFAERNLRFRHEEIKYKGNDFFKILYGREVKPPALPISEVTDIALTLKQEGSKIFGYAIFKDKQGRQIGLSERVKAKLDFFCGEVNPFFHEWSIEPDDFYYLMVAGGKEEFFGVPQIQELMLPEICDGGDSNVSLRIEGYNKEITCIITP